MSDLHALVAPYALDAIDDLERRRFAAHLQECETCIAQMSGFAAAAASLAGAATTAPPSHLRSKILTNVASVPQDRSFSQRPRRTWRRVLPVLAVAAALVVPVTGAANHLTAERSSADAVAASTSMSSVLAAPDAATRSEVVAGGGSIRVVTSRVRGDAVVAVDRLPPLADDQTYQLWTFASGSANARGIFATSTIVTAGRIGSADHVAVTVEPKGGSERPTSLPIAVLPL